MNNIELTFSMVKPCAVKRNLIGQIIAAYEEKGLKIIALKKIQLSIEDAKAFYAVHKERPFFNGLVTYMSSGPVVAMILEGENAVLKTREIMGATNPQEAAEGTLRKRFGIDIESNAVHGSDSKENAAIEAGFFFNHFEKC